MRPKILNVHIIIATDSIADSVEDERYSEGQQTLAQIRSTELSNAAVALGITSIWSLPYRDSGMRGSSNNAHPKALIQQPLESLTAQLHDYTIYGAFATRCCSDPRSIMKVSRGHIQYLMGGERESCFRGSNDGNSRKTLRR